MSSKSLVFNRSVWPCDEPVQNRFGSLEKENRVASNSNAFISPTTPRTPKSHGPVASPSANQGRLVSSPVVPDESPRYEIVKKPKKTPSNPQNQSKSENQFTKISSPTPLVHRKGKRRSISPARTTVIEPPRPKPALENSQPDSTPRDESPSPRDESPSPRDESPSNVSPTTTVIVDVETVDERPPEEMESVDNEHRIQTSMASSSKSSQSKGKKRGRPSKADPSQNAAAASHQPQEQLKKGRRRLTKKLSNPSLQLLDSTFNAEEPIEAELRSPAPKKLKKGSRNKADDSSLPSRGEECQNEVE